MRVEVSVAMATYMGSAHLRQQLHSVLGQTVLPAEIVICDDRSSDDTVRIIREFASASAVPIRLFTNEERLGWRANFMKAASLCRSELIAFCDQDDVWAERKLELIIGAVERTGALMVFHDAVTVGPDLRPIEPFLQGAGEPDLARALERGPWRDVYGFTMAFRRDLLDHWDLWEASVDKSAGSQRAAHDQWLLFLGNSLGATLHLREPLVLYRQHDQNAVGVKDAFRPTPWITGFVRYRDVVNLRIVVLESRIQTLQEMVQQGGSFSCPAASALTMHESYRDQIAVQLDIYNSDAFRTRLVSFVALLSRRSYGGGVWSLGRPQALNDALAVLLGPHVVAWLARIEKSASRQGSRPFPRRGCPSRRGPL